MAGSSLKSPPKTGEPIKALKEIRRGLGLRKRRKKGPKQIKKRKAPRIKSSMKGAAVQQKSVSSRALKQHIPAKTPMRDGSESVPAASTFQNQPTKSEVVSRDHKASSAMKTRKARKEESTVKRLEELYAVKTAPLQLRRTFGKLYYVETKSQKRRRD